MGRGLTREARIRRTRAWLRYSSRDLRVARLLLRSGAEAEPYHTAFWAQQSAEKAIKAGLVYAGVPFSRTHDLNELVELLPADYRTRRVAGALGELSDYGVETRYPDLGEPEPTEEDARRAVEQAGAVQGAVQRDLEAHGFPITPSVTGRRGSDTLEPPIPPASQRDGDRDR